MTEDSGGRRRGSGSSGSDPESDDSRPLTAAGRRQRSRGSESGSSVASQEKGAPTRSRDAARAAATAPASPLARLQRFLREVVAELRKVHWPTRRQIVVYTGVVLVFVAFMVALVSLLDIGFQKLTFALFG